MTMTMMAIDMYLLIYKAGFLGKVRSWCGCVWVWVYGLERGAFGGGWFVPMYCYNQYEYVCMYFFNFFFLGVTERWLAASNKHFTLT